MPQLERYHEVFVSSTYLDLVSERQAVLQTLLKLNCLPIGMELFPNGDPDVWGLIQRLIRRCDLYVLIVGGRYGTPYRDTGKSFTHHEYLEAVAHGKKILVYPHVAPQNHKPEMWERQTPSEKASVLEFLRLVGERATSPWSDVSQLRANLAIDLASCLRELPGGWTRAPENVLDSFREEIQAVRGRFDGPEIRELTRLLQTTLQQFQFSHTNARIEKLGEVLPWLSKKEWDLLVDFARAQTMVRSEAVNAVDQPMKRSIVDLVAHYQAQLKNVESGVVEVEGELINAVAGYFIAAVRKSFRALSNRDFEFWRSEESKPYYENTLRLIKADIEVERIFVMPRSSFSEPGVREVIHRQLSDKVKVRIISSEDIRAIVPSQLDRDFGLHDSLAVSFFRNYYGRSYKVDTRREVVNQFMRRFARVSESSEIVPGKSEGDTRLFENTAEFETWLEQLPSTPLPNGRRLDDVDE